MRDITAIVPLPLHDKRLRPNRLLHRAEHDVMAKHFPLYRMRKPAVIDPSHPIARSKNHIDAIIAAKRLAQPMWKLQLGAVTGRFERHQCRSTIPRLYKNIEILCMSFQPRMASVRISPADQKRHTRLFQIADRALIKIAANWIESRSAAGQHLHHPRFFLSLLLPSLRGKSTAAKPMPQTLAAERHLRV